MIAPAGGPESEPPGGGRRWYFGRWYSLAASVVGAGTATGLGYCFSTYSPAIKAELGLSQTALDSIANAPSFMMLPPIVLVPGLLFDHCGPRTTVAAAAAGLFFGYGTMWLAAAGHARDALPAAWIALAVALAYCVASFGSGTATVALMGTGIKNFPGHRGGCNGILLRRYATRFSRCAGCC